ncbi:MAG: nuclear transport factor 2 family protein [Sphingobium phenoxybenzoativorans]
MAHDIQYLSDYVDIRQLNALYNRYADIGDGQAYSSLYTVDAEFNIVGNRIYRGRAEIASAAAATSVTVHVTTETELDIQGDRAFQKVRFISCYRAPDKAKNDFVATGWYIDELRRTDEGWRYHRRRVELDLDTNEVFRKMTISDQFNALAEAQ